MGAIKLIECPRDAIQGYPSPVSTSLKIAYYQMLLKVGFDTLDCGSFVSPKAIPQMADTAAVIQGLDCSDTPTKLLTIVANLRGAEEAVTYDKIHYLGYPFSVSENFQVRNTGKTIEESLVVLKQIQELTALHNKELVVYLSMGFGNPYGDPWNTTIISNWVALLADLGINIISLSDTVGSAQTKDVEVVFSKLISAYPALEFGAHFHALPEEWFAKINAAYGVGCRRFDGTIKGLGGCPMAHDHLVGNIPMEKLISFTTAKQLLAKSFDTLAFESAFNFSHKIFI
jgi:hydroxymethylglutaryl-CoA lyase